MGLRNGDLENLIDQVCEIDSYQSKMGSDKDIVVLSFSVKNEGAAKDLVNFVEAGYQFVLDAAHTTGEMRDGIYKVFIEMERNKEIADNITEICDGVKNLSSHENMRFRYYKSFKSNDVTVENINGIVPIDPQTYELTIQENAMNNYTNFFNKGYVDSITMIEDSILVNKKYADSLKLEVVDFGKSNDIQEKITEKFNVNDFGEILFLTKYLGEYTISKYGDTLAFENNGYTLLAKRK
tara:strand:- start:691 stop:1404 length:714 start_codon:yes stop_codon:yes gene_type:complete